MKTENLGEIFLDGRIITLDNMSDKDLNNLLNQIKAKEETCMNKLNDILAEIQ